MDEVPVVALVAGRARLTIPSARIITADESPR
jgi:hypothetical protein